MLGVLAGCTAAIDQMGGSGDPALLAGYWVWARTIENNEVKLEISDDDLKIDTWPGCPVGITCTHFGYKKLAFGPQGEFWYMTNATTSSDSNHIGDYSVTKGTINIDRSISYSCAHPGVPKEYDKTEYAAWSMVGDELWVSATVFLADPPVVTNDWVVYRRVSEADFYGKYMIRVCQDRGKDPRCYEGCFSRDYGR